MHRKVNYSGRVLVERGRLEAAAERGRLGNRSGGGLEIAAGTAWKQQWGRLGNSSGGFLETAAGAAWKQQRGGLKTAAGWLGNSSEATAEGFGNSSESGFGTAAGLGGEKTAVLTVWEQERGSGVGEEPGAGWFGGL